MDANSFTILALVALGLALAGLVYLARD